MSKSAQRPSFGHPYHRTGLDRDDGTGNGTPGALLASLLHDASEAYVIDVPRPLKLHLAGYKEIENRVSGAIYTRFGIDGYDRSHAAIKTCDNILLATEKRDLMPAHSATWGGLPDPLPERIIPWSPETAKRRFLENFAWASAK